MIGSTLSHFRITAKLGAGGMGEVYRAEDTTLGREVAIKVLPTAFVADVDRLARFEREARTLASLSHPNIASIHQVGHEEGTHFLVMELAAGETLADRISRGRLPLDEALPIALQIAEALEAAHERGIVHRDLKPANVMVDAGGRVKVLDFGLAKALTESGEGASADLAASPTLTRQATMAGVLLGTAAYMSPEQAKGRPADRRSDIWAFGLLLLEMLTGRSTFAADTLTETLAAVLRSEPDLAALPPELPVTLRRLLARCLRKDPHSRLQSIGDARVVLEELARGEVADADGAAPPARTGAARGGLRFAAWALGALCLALAGLVVWLVSRGPALVPETLRLELTLPAATRLGLDHQEGVLALSPDGLRMAVVVNGVEGIRRLALRDLRSPEMRLLEGTEDAMSPFFSPDGESIGYFAGDALWRVAVTGGAPVRVAPVIDDGRGGTWAEDGYIYAAPSTSVPLQRVRESGGQFEAVLELDAARRERTHRWPHALPGGKAVLFTSDTEETTELYDDARIEALDLSTRQRTVVVEGSSAAQYLPGGHLVFARGGALYGVRFDPDRLVTTGAPALVAQSVVTTIASGAVHFSLAHSGTLLYAAGEGAAAPRVPRWLGFSGSEENSTIPPGSYRQIALSPDGKRAALLVLQDGKEDLWVAELSRGTLTRLTFDGDASDPLWSRDGRWVLYGGPRGVLRKRSDGGGQPEVVWRPGPGTSLPCALTPDGRFLVAERIAKGSDLWLVPLDGGEARPLVQTPRADRMADLSPDGRWLAYFSTESGRPEVYVIPLADDGGKWQVTTGSGFEPRWAPDGRALYFRSIRGELYRVPVQTGDGFLAGAPERVATGLMTGNDSNRAYALAPDGQRALALGLNVQQNVDRLRLVLGWRGEVERILADRQ